MTPLDNHLTALVFSSRKVGPQRLHALCGGLSRFPGLLSLSSAIGRLPRQSRRDATFALRSHKKDKNAVPPLLLRSRPSAPPRMSHSRVDLSNVDFQIPANTPPSFFRSLFSASYKSLCAKTPRDRFSTSLLSETYKSLFQQLLCFLIYTKHPGVTLSTLHRQPPGSGNALPFPLSSEIQPPARSP